LLPFLLCADIGIGIAVVGVVKNLTQMVSLLLQYSYN